MWLNNKIKPGDGQRIIAIVDGECGSGTYYPEDSKEWDDEHGEVFSPDDRHSDHFQWKEIQKWTPFPEKE